MCGGVQRSVVQLRRHYRARNNFRAGYRGVYLESQHFGGGGRRTKNSRLSSAQIGLHETQLQPGLHEIMSPE